MRFKNFRLFSALLLPASALTMMSCSQEIAEVATTFEESIETDEEAMQYLLDNMEQVYAIADRYMPKEQNEEVSELSRSLPFDEEETETIDFEQPKIEYHYDEYTDTYFPIMDKDEALELYFDQEEIINGSHDAFQDMAAQYPDEIAQMISEEPEVADELNGLLSDVEIDENEMDVTSRNTTSLLIAAGVSVYVAHSINAALVSGTFILKRKLVPMGLKNLLACAAVAVIAVLVIANGRLIRPIFSELLMTFVRSLGAIASFVYSLFGDIQRKGEASLGKQKYIAGIAGLVGVMDASDKKGENSEKDKIYAAGLLFENTIMILYITNIDVTNNYALSKKLYDVDNGTFAYTSDKGKRHMINTLSNPNVIYHYKHKPGAFSHFHPMVNGVQSNGHSGHVG